MKLKKAIQLWWYKRKISKLKPKREDATLVYTDAQGNKWYTVSPASMHATRALTAWVQTKDLDFGITREKLQRGLNKITDLLNENKPSDASEIVGVLKAALDIYAEPEVLLNIASCYTFLNDEPDEYKEHIQKNKKDIWEKDYECRSFFLQYAITYTDKHSKSQVKNAQEYLQGVKPVLDQINYHLQAK